MAQKPRQVRMESRSALAHMQQLETRSDEELEAETKYRAAAQAILGARAAERMDAKTARVHFRQAIASARPQERLQLRRMAEASLALAERRAGDLKVATEKLGQPAPTNRQLLALRFVGLISPGPTAGVPRRIGAVLLVVFLLLAILALGFALVKLIALPFGGLSTQLSIFWGFVLAAVVLGALVWFGRRRQRAAREKAAERRAEQARRLGRR